MRHTSYVGDWPHQKGWGGVGVGVGVEVRVTYNLTQLSGRNYGIKSWFEGRFGTGKSIMVYITYVAQRFKQMFDGSVVLYITLYIIYYIILYYFIIIIIIIIILLSYYDQYYHHC